MMVQAIKIELSSQYYQRNTSPYVVYAIRKSKLKGQNTKKLMRFCFCVCAHGERSLI